MKTTLITLTILFVHWIADFVCQTDWQAKNKSKDNNALLSHTIIYSIIWCLAASLIFSFQNTPLIAKRLILQVVTFVLVTFICHTVTDYLTSRLNSKLWKKEKVHNFFVSIGFDQWLHAAQLLLTYQLIINL